jgi:predicted nucleic acid-binding protein
VKNRTGFDKKPLGTYATHVFLQIFNEKIPVVISPLLVRELTKELGEQETNNLLMGASSFCTIEKIFPENEDAIEAERIAKERKVPQGDVIHAILARRSGAILISPDSDFDKLKDIVDWKRPEEILPPFFRL